MGGGLSMAVLHLLLYGWDPVVLGDVVAIHKTNHLMAGQVRVEAREPPDFPGARPEENTRYLSPLGT